MATATGITPATPSARPARPVALITGASSGIGAEFARQLAPAYDLILVARRADRLEEGAAKLRAAGCACEILVADLTADAGSAAVAARIGAEPRLELLVNNAGFGSKGYFWQTDYPAQVDMHRLHILATVSLCRSALEAFTARNRGAIINVASVAAFVRGAGSASYAATKTWMTAFSEGLYLELRQAGSAVTIQAVCPGFTYSEFHDVAQIDRSARAPRSLWLSADHVVRDSLAALPRGTLFVVPGWRYKLIVALASKLPIALRLGFESRRS